MTLRFFFYVLACLCLAPASAQQILLQGTISLHNSKYTTGEIQFVNNAQVLAAFTTPAVTDNQGTFALEFVGLDAGTSIEVDVEKSQLEVVNDRDLKDVVIGRRTPLRIYMASKGKLRESQMEIYNISKKALYAGHNRMIEQLKSESAAKDSLLAQLNERYEKQLRDQYAAIEFLEEQRAELEKQLVPMAQELAYINLDFASELYIEAYEYFRTGDISKAIEILDDAKLDQAAADAFTAIEVADRITEKAETELQQVVESYKLKSKSHELQFELQDAAIALEKAIAIQQQMDKSFDLIRNLRDVAMLHRDLAAFDTAITRLMLAKQIQEQDLPANDHEASITHDYISGILNELGRYDEALEYAKTSLRLAQSALEPDHPDLAEAHAAMSVAFRQLKQPEEALRHQREVVRIRSKIEDRLESKLGGSYSQMAVIYGELLGQPDSALYYQEKALEIDESTLEPNHPKLSRSYSNMGRVYRDLGQHEKSLAYHHKALEIRRNILGPNHPSTGLTHSNLAVEYRYLNQSDTARYHADKSVQIYETAYKPGHPALYGVYNNATTIYQSLGLYEQALEYGMKAIEILDGRVPPLHRAYGTPYHNIAQVYKGMEKWEKALEYEQKTIEIDAANLPENHRYRAISLNVAAEICMGMEDFKQALEYAEQAVLVNAERPLDPNLRTSFRLAANALDAMGKEKKAAEYHTKADAINTALEEKQNQDR